MDQGASHRLLWLWSGRLFQSPFRQFALSLRVLWKDEAGKFPPLPVSLLFWDTLSLHLLAGRLFSTHAKGDALKWDGFSQRRRWLRGATIIVNVWVVVLLQSPLYQLARIQQPIRWSCGRGLSRGGTSTSRRNHVADIRSQWKAFAKTAYASSGLCTFFSILLTYEAWLGQLPLFNSTLSLSFVNNSNSPKATPFLRWRKKYT